MIDFGCHAYSKEQQLQSRRGKPSQRQKGAINKTVDMELKERSGGVCELRMKCAGVRATERAHTMGRRIIPAKTTVEDLLHCCTECHVWLDRMAEGIRLRRDIREMGTSAYVIQAREAEGYVKPI